MASDGTGRAFPAVNAFGGGAGLGILCNHPEVSGPGQGEVPAAPETLEQCFVLRAGRGLSGNLAEIPEGLAVQSRRGRCLAVAGEGRVRGRRWTFRPSWGTSAPSEE